MALPSLLLLIPAWAPGLSRMQHQAMHARRAHAAMLDDSLMDTFPSEQMSPVCVTELQLKAFQQLSMKEGSQLFWRYMSPEGKRDTGILRPSRRAYLVPPRYHELPTYAPLMRATKFAVVGALSIGEDQYQCRVRVWPATGGDRECAGGYMAAPPIEYIWRLTKQPRTRPSCYEDDPLQQGISTGPPFGGCWLVDDVRFDERFGNGGDDEGGAPAPPTPSDDNIVRIGLRRAAVSRTSLVTMKSSDRPVMLKLPSGVASVDELTAEKIKGYGADDLQAALEQLEVAIFGEHRQLLHMMGSTRIASTRIAC